MAKISLKGTLMHTIGNLPPVGSPAPDFVVTKINLSEAKLSDFQGKKVVLNVFPSLDTPVCATTMIQFSEIAKQFPDVIFLCVSADVPFAQQRFCAAEHIENVQALSVFRHTEFGKEYGVFIMDGPLAGLLSRAVIVVNEQGEIIHTEQVTELSDEPNYAAVLASLK